MIDLEELAADDVATYDGAQPTMAAIAARAGRRAVNRRRRLAGGSLVAVAVVGGAVMALAGGGGSQEIDAAATGTAAPVAETADEATDRTVTSPDGTAGGNTISLLGGSWVGEILASVAEQVPEVSEAELQAVLDSGEIDPAFRPDGVDSWDGLFLAADHRVADGADAAEIVRSLHDAFVDTTRELGYGTVEAPLGLSPYEVLVVASIVEAEGVNDADKAKVARVIYNRLAAGMSLDIDSVCLYALRDRDAELSREVMTGTGIDPAYACRDNPGLPPTPVAAPSQASLEAAIAPAANPIEDGAEVVWLFYTATDADGNVLVTGDIDEFLDQVERSNAAGVPALAPPVVSDR